MPHPTLHQAPCFPGVRSRAWRAGVQQAAWVQGVNAALGVLQEWHAGRQALPGADHDLLLQQALALVVPDPHQLLRAALKAALRFPGAAAPNCARHNSAQHPPICYSS